MKKIMIIDNNYPINTRNIRIMETLKKSNFIKICAWDRLNKYSSNDEYIFSTNHGYGKKIKKFFGMFEYFKFIKKKIENEKPDLIIASQWDILFLVCLLKFNGKIIYENLDIPSLKNKFLTKVALKIEKYSLKKVHAIIFASRFFEELYIKNNTKKIVLENLPSLNIIKKEYQKIEKNKRIKISFIGGLRYFNVLKNLLLAAKDLNLDIYLIGKGPDEKKIKNFIKKEELINIYLVGEYDYKDIKKFYVDTDCVWAVYPSSELNVKYAISNKFFESIIFEKPCIFASDTLLGKYVREEKIGWTIQEDSISKIREFLKKINNEEIKAITDNIADYKNKLNYLFWEDQEEKLIKFIEEL